MLPTITGERQPNSNTSVRGSLYDWILSGTGVWYGCCDFSMPYWDGRGVVEVSDQLVPQHLVKRIVPESDSACAYPAVYRTIDIDGDPVRPLRRHFRSTARP